MRIVADLEQSGFAAHEKVKNVLNKASFAFIESLVVLVEF